MKLINYVISICFTCCHNHGHNMFFDVNVFDFIRTLQINVNDKQVVARFLVKYEHIFLVQRFYAFIFLA